MVMKLRHKISVWTLILIVFAQSLGVSMLYGLYNVDKPVFVTLFCINKAQPELDCGGACMISKLDDQTQQDNDYSKLQNISQFQLFFYPQHFNIQFIAIDVLNMKHQFHYQNLHGSQHLSELLKPPTVV